MLRDRTPLYRPFSSSFLSVILKIFAWLASVPWLPSVHWLSSSYSFRRTSCSAFKGRPSPKSHSPLSIFQSCLRISALSLFPLSYVLFSIFTVLFFFGLFLLYPFSRSLRFGTTTRRWLFIQNDNLWISSRMPSFVVAPSPPAGTGGGGVE